MTPWMTRIAVLLCCALSASCSNLVSIEPTGADIELAPQLETSVVTAGDGTVLAELHAEQDRDLVPLTAIPAVVREAVVAVEDARFYDHGGVDGRAIARAVVTNLVEGDIRQGGSTITQQLVKNAIVGDEESLDRKLAEASIALQLESQMTKDEILEQYLNTVYFGNGAYGVGAAARRYFDLEVSELRLHHAALLAGMLRAPAHYDPHVEPGAATTRRNLVLRLMAEQSMVTSEESAQAAAAPLDVVPRSASQDWLHAYAVDHALDRLQHDPVFHVLGATPAERAVRLFGGGLRIETTIDPASQRQAEGAVAATLVDAADPRAALVAIDPSNGHIRALVGGRDYHDPVDPVARFNLATDGRRQPGSAFKVLVLAAALEAGWSLQDTLPAPATITLEGALGSADWTVGNAGQQGYGDLTLRTATALSVNVVYAQLVTDIGPQAVIDLARRAGITSPLQPLGSIALGAQEVSPLEMATVTATFAAGGVHHDPTIIRRIIDRDGVVIWEHPDGQGTQVIDATTTGQVTLALQDVITSGTGMGAALGRPTAGKTGTSQDNADAWFTGYTPDLAVAVWVGFPEGRIAMTPPRTRIEVQGSSWPAEIFARFGTAALRDQVATPFSLPGQELVTVQVDLTRDCLPNPYTPRDLIGERGYVAGTEPTEVCAQPDGPPTVDVPPVVGMRVEQAREALHAAGFTVLERPQYATEVPGTVLTQSPPAGAGQLLAETGFLATVTVASADRTGTIVPDVVGRTVDVARQTLEADGFGVEVRLVCPDGGTVCADPQARPGVVWQQTPEAAQRVP
ncbi:MAG TPA: transglycosylase domain-containing protein, partial [Euzebya sp.]|nr:transglycosylase domain-containing protein [Euzebya sp.]